MTASARADLLALTADDLATLSNRGIVKRAQQEIEAGEPSVTIEEDGGAVVFRWSDGAVCTFAAGKGVRGSVCSCPATTVCRHRIRSVLAYQAAAPQAAPVEGPWDPGTIGDDALAAHFSAAALGRARSQFEEGHVVELLRAAKPSALLHSVPALVRFLVPHDLRYTHCDCSETPPCIHVPIAIWSFRLLGADANSGVVSTRTAAPEVPEALLASLESVLIELAALGFAGVPRALLDRARRLEQQSREAGLVWPAEVLADLLEQLEAYAAHDARFSSETFARLAGELCIRIDAIREAPPAVPQLFVRGMRTDRLTEVGTARLVGVGCSVETTRAGATVSALLQDVASGMVVAVTRFKGIPIPSIGSGQLLARGGKRTSGGRFTPLKATLNPQSYQWEHLRAPLRVESVAELRAQLETQPIAALRPRRVSDRLHVLAVKSVSGVHFDPAEQTIAAVMSDAEDGAFRVEHRYTTRGAAGFEALLRLLTEAGPSIRFVSGYVTLAAGEVVVDPIGVVHEQNGARMLLQPHVDAPAAAASSPAPRHEPRRASTALQDLRTRLTAAVGDTFVVGLPRCAPALWSDLLLFARGLGALRMSDTIAAFTEALDRAHRTPTFDPHPPGLALLQLAVLAEVANEI
ncbi:MAG TPA: hypothetical protein VF432_26545 [Thermoanaerobaculia bacterium]